MPRIASVQVSFSREMLQFSETVLNAHRVTALAEGFSVRHSFIRKKPCREPVQKGHTVRISVICPAEQRVVASASESLNFCSLGRTAFARPAAPVSGALDTLTEAALCLSSLEDPATFVQEKASSHEVLCQGPPSQGPGTRGRATLCMCAHLRSSLLRVGFTFSYSEGGGDPKTLGQFRLRANGTG